MGREVHGLAVHVDKCSGEECTCWEVRPLDLDLDNPAPCRFDGAPAYRDRNSNIWYHLEDRSHRVMRPGGSLYGT